MGAARAAQLAWLDSPESGLYIHIVFFLIIAAPQVTKFVPFSGSQLYGNANPFQADDGSDRGPAQGLSRWAKASVGSGDKYIWRSPVPRVVRALPFSDEFLAFWARQGPVNHSWGQTRTASAAAAKRSRTCSLSARHNAPRPAHAPISRMRVRARHRCQQHAMGAAVEVLAQDAEREQQREEGQVESVGAPAAPRPEGCERARALTASSSEGGEGGTRGRWRRWGRGYGG